MDPVQKEDGNRDRKFIRTCVLFAVCKMSYKQPTGEMRLKRLNTVREQFLFKSEVV
jgi:hypothetical protein